MRDFLMLPGNYRVEREIVTQALNSHQTGTCSCRPHRVDIKNPAAGGTRGEWGSTGRPNYFFAVKTYLAIWLLWWEAVFL